MDTCSGLIFFYFFFYTRLCIKCPNFWLIIFYAYVCGKMHMKKIASYLNICRDAYFYASFLTLFK